MSLTPGTKLGSYEILGSIGSGGMGAVYRAKHVKLGREAAIKVLPPELASDPERLRRFEREDKRHVLLEGGHIFPDRVALLEEVVAWFDRYLGRVETASPSS